MTCSVTDFHPIRSITKTTAPTPPVKRRDFLETASHELRTPLAVVQNESSVALGRVDRPAAEYQDALQVIRSAGRRMARIVDDLFDRFVRGDAARSHVDDFSSGAGLGLPIARWIAQAHGVRVELERTSAAGSLFAVTFSNRKPATCPAMSASN